MTLRTLLSRSLRFYARAHLGVILGATIGSTALIGALIIGDCVRGTLRDRAIHRLANASFALASADRFFSQQWDSDFTTVALGQANQLRVVPPDETRDNFRRGLGAPLLALSGTAATPSASARVNHVQVYGVSTSFWAFVGANRFSELSGDTVLLNRTLASQLGVREGDDVLLRVAKPQQLSPEAAVTRRSDASTAWRVKVAGIVPSEEGGDFSLRMGGSTPANAFVALEEFARRVGVAEKANTLLLGPVVMTTSVGNPNSANLIQRAQQVWAKYLGSGRYRPPEVLAPTEEAVAALSAGIRRAWNLEDLDLRLQAAPEPFSLELRTPRVFLDRIVARTISASESSNSVPMLTFLANLILHGTNSTPYSMITAAGPPYTPADLPDDEILVNQWLADDLHLAAGDRVSLVYFLPESGTRLLEATNGFRIRAILPLDGIYADRTLMPDFPGIEKAESTLDWDAGFPLVYKVRPKDDQYWRARRGTPKAFVTLAAGRRIWGNRFGDVTSIRFLAPTNALASGELKAKISQRILSTIPPADLGFRFEPVRDQALKGVAESQDFGQLFLGFSFFLVVAALMLMGLLFQFGLEQRTAEVGTLLAVGFKPRQVKRLWLLEGSALSLIGGILGIVGGVGYAEGMLWALRTIWSQAVGAAALSFHVTGETILIGAFSSILMAVLTLWLTLRKLTRRTVHELLALGPASQLANSRSRALWIAVPCGTAALGISAWMLVTRDTTNAEAFFSAGSLLLIAGLAAASSWFAAAAHQRHDSLITLGSLGVRGCARRRSRSVATIALLASGSFIILAIGVFRLDALQDANRRSSGTGGFALIGESSLPIVQDLNSYSGRDAFGLQASDLAGVSVVPFRVHDGDDASCLNLNRAQRPRLLGVDPGLLAGRFAFAELAKEAATQPGWFALRSDNDPKTAAPETIPAIGDANSIQWALGKKVGDTLDYTDGQGRPFKLKLVGAVANSILQGNLVINEAEFIRRFPNESGRRFFLIDAPSNSVAEVSAKFSRALQDEGLELTRTVQRLNDYNAVQNTYLSTFQVLGGLGLLIGSAGLGVVVLRNVLERRGELALLLAVGFRRSILHRLILSEHGVLLGLGLLLGVIAAAVAVLPSLLSPATEIPYASLSLTLAAVLVNGSAWAWLATRYALRGNLLKALRND